MAYKRSSDGMMAVKPEPTMEEVMEVEREPEQPRVSFDSEEIPGLKDWKVGEEYKLEVKVKLHKLEDEDEVVCGKFELLAVKSV